MIDAATINNKIEINYPTLKVRFSQVFKTISFDIVINQLMFAFSELEITRCLHRLHCILHYFVLEPSKIPHHLDIFNDLSESQQQALLALIVIDACKGTKEISAKFNENGHAPLNDSVPFFFDTLSKNPEIYVIFNAISLDAQKYIREHIFYLHLRHLHFGEIPLSALSDFEALYAEGSDISLAVKKVNFVCLFWIANLLGFDIARLPKEGSLESYFEVATPQECDQFRVLHSTLQKAIKVCSLAPVKSYFCELVPKSLLQSLPEKPSVDVLLYIGRTVSLLRSCKKHLVDLDSLSILISTLYPFIKETSLSEKKCYSAMHLLAITFSPALFWKLEEMHAGKKSLEEIAIIYLKLQTALQNAFGRFTEDEKLILGNNRTLSLFSLTTPDNMEALVDFSANPTKSIQLAITIKNGFIVMKANCVRNTALMAKNPRSFYGQQRAVKGESQNAPSDSRPGYR